RGLLRSRHVERLDRRRDGRRRGGDQSLVERAARQGTLGWGAHEWVLLYAVDRRRCPPLGTDQTVRPCDSHLLPADLIAAPPALRRPVLAQEADGRRQGRLRVAGEPRPLR